MKRFLVFLTPRMVETLEVMVDDAIYACEQSGESFFGELEELRQIKRAIALGEWS